MMIVHLTLLMMVMLAKQGCSATSFVFPNFSDQNAKELLRLEKDAYLSSNRLELTKKLLNVYFSYGWASRKTAVQLWDPRTGRLADFDTHFTFSINKLENVSDQDSGDGLAFFLAPFDAVIPEDSCGENLGLFDPRAAAENDSSVNRFVAVEFDTFLNSWDP